MVNTEVRDLPTFEQVPYTLYECDDYSSTAACAAAKYSLFKRDTEGLL